MPRRWISAVSDTEIQLYLDEKLTGLGDMDYNKVISRLAEILGPVIFAFAPQLAPNHRIRPFQLGCDFVNKTPTLIGSRSDERQELPALDWWEIEKTFPNT